jgi:putative ABC transport system permease protein
MLNPRQIKILREMWVYRTRTALVVIAIAIGVGVFGLMGASQIILERDLANDFAATHPADAILTVSPFGDELLAKVAAVDGVQAAEARHLINATMETASGQWTTLELQAIPDFKGLAVSRLALEPGSEAPPPRDGMLLERSILAGFGFKNGQVLRVKLPNGRTRDLTVAGFVNDLGVAPFPLSSVARGYITLDTLRTLGESRDYNQLYVVVAGHPTEPAVIERVITRVVERVELAGQQVLSAPVPEPGKPLFANSLKGVLIILESLGTLTLALSAFLIINVMGAVLAQQIPQIGILKSLGGRANQILWLYMEMVLIFGALALCLAVPLGIVGAYFMTRSFARSLNFDLVSFGWPLQTWLMQAFGALLVPVLAALVPILNGARITIRQAIGGYELAAGSSAGFMGPWIERLPRLHILSLRNAFRRPGRVWLTLAALSLAGAMAISTLGIRQSLRQASNELHAQFKYDVQLDFDKPYPLADLKRELLPVPGVVGIEGRGVADARRVYGDDRLGGSITLIGLPADTQLSDPYVNTGRWLRSGDEQVIFLNADLLDVAPDLSTGKQIVLRVGDKEKDRNWRVIGIGGRQLEMVAYIDYADFERLTGVKGYVSRLVIKTVRSDPTSQSAVERDLLARFEKTDWHIVQSSTTTEAFQNSLQQLDIISVMLLATTILVAIVGGLGLASTMGLNVMERTRELGVLRALGAKDEMLRRLVIGEGLIIGLTSCLLGVILSVPLSLALGDALGYTLLYRHLDYVFSVDGLLLWLVFIIILSLAASIVPAQRAARLTIRETLAYDG